MNRYLQHYVGGVWTANDGQDAQALINPANGRKSGELQFCSSSNVDTAVRAAQNGFQLWSRSSLNERRNVLERLGIALQSRAAELVRSFAEEIGCPVSIGQFIQVVMPSNNLKFITEGIDQIVWEETIRNSKVVRVPAGVIAGITPWNAPLHQIVSKVAGVIGAGTSIVLKPSELAPQTAILFAQAVHESGLPPGVFNLVWGGAEIGRQLVEHPGIDFVSFTGSDGVGRQIMASASLSLKRTSTELGGKSAAIVLEDADLETAVSAVFHQSMINSGQTCVCQSRLLVPATQLAQTEEILGAAATALRVGDPYQTETQMGPVASRSQADRVKTFVARAKADGARLVVGGTRPPELPEGFFVQPTVYSNVDPGSWLAQREVFGPVLAIIPYESEAQAVTIANGTSFGLSGAVWSQDTKKAESFARQLRTGQVIVNGAAQNLAAPSGGFAQSGFGRENGRFSIEAFLEHHAIQLPS